MHANIIQENNLTHKVT